MKNIEKKMVSALMAAALCLSMLGGCASKNDASAAASTSSGTGQETQETDQQQGTSDALLSPFTVASVGEFTTQDIHGETVTQDIFKDYDLTLVNIFATWCSPCVGEMPDLEKLHQQMADRGVNVVGVVLDTLDENGEIIQEELELAQQLEVKTGVTYPILLPDPGYFNGRLTGIDAIPETFFVDKNGNIVGETYTGSGTLEDWIEIVEKELASLKESN